MIRLCFIGFLFLWSCAVFAQSPFKLGYRLDYEQSTMLNRDINRFFNSYNGYYGNNMDVPLDTINANATSHFNHGFSIRYFDNAKTSFFMGLEFFWGKNELERNGRFANGIQTQCDFLFKDFTFQTDVGFKAGPLVLAGIMAGRVRQIEFDLGYIYQDGTYSLGNEYDVLSAHTSMHTTLDLGFSLGIKLKRFYISYQRTQPTNFASDNGLLTLLDFDERQIRWSDVPTDFEKWANDPANLKLENGFVRASSFATARNSFSIEFLIFGE
ncbi:MAG: hypothetical protein JXQ87_05040 [Bacteroidia bacterium]